MNKLKVVTVIGTRPEIIRLSRVIAKLNASPAIDHTLVHTGQNYDHELNGVFFEDMDIPPPDHYLDAAGRNAAESIGNTIARVDEILEKISPQAYLVLGDTNSCLGAIAAKRRRIPVFHMEAGNRCYDHRVPEELNRRIVDHVADINLPYSSIARSYLLREGIPPDRIIKTGSPMFEILNYYKKKIQASDILKKLKLEKEHYFIVSAHREENIDFDKQFSSLTETLNMIGKKYKLPVIVTTHPRTRHRIEEEKVKLSSEVQLHKPFGFTDYIHLQMNARATMSDSGTINEESSILNFPALNIRESFERPEGMEEAAVMLTGLEPDRVLQGVEQLSDQNRSERNFQLVDDYKAPNVSDKIVRIIISYVDYVKRTVWQDL